MIPILVTCKNRLRYLDATLKSISLTVPAGVVVYVVDDGSVNSDMIDYLTTDRVIHVNDYEFPNGNNEWITRIGFIPNHDVQGVKGKVNVILKEPPSEGVKTFTSAIRYIFEKNKCSHVIKVQDDVVFKQGWYSAMKKSALKSGITSGFRHFFDSAKLSIVNGNTDILEAGHVGGICLMISLELCKDKPILINNDVVRTRDMDDFWTDNCRSAGMSIHVTNPGVCQHVGFKSLVYQGTHKQFMFDGSRTRGIDNELFPPYVIGESIREMTHGLRIY